MVYRTWKDKEGKDLMGKNGKKYEKVSVKAIEYGDRFIGGFGGEWNRNWKEGDEILLDINEVDYNGKKYLNFSKVDMEQRMMEMITELNKRVTALEKEKQDKQDIETKGYAYPEKTEEPNFDVPPDEIPPDEAFEQL